MTIDSPRPAVTPIAPVARLFGVVGGRNGQRRCRRRHSSAYNFALSTARQHGNRRAIRQRHRLDPEFPAELLFAVTLKDRRLRVQSQFWELITSESSIAALWLSLKTSAASTVLCVLRGTPMALVLARSLFPGLRLARSLVLLPLVLPPVVGGIALIYTFGRQGLLGGTLEFLGLRIAFTTTAVVIAQTFVALPFLVLSLEGALRTAGLRYEAVAATLGANPTTVLRRVTVPLVLPGLISGGVLAFARALGEYGATLTFAGSLQGVTRTLPLEIYLQRETDPDAAVALSLVLVAVAVLIVLATRGRTSEGSL